MVSEASKKKAAQKKALIVGSTLRAMAPVGHGLSESREKSGEEHAEKKARTEEEDKKPCTAELIASNTGGEEWDDELTPGEEESDEELTPEEWKHASHYMDKLEENSGFDDIPIVPYKVLYNGMPWIVAENVTPEDSDLYEVVNIAIRHYCQKKKTNLELVRILGINSEFTRGGDYYITLDAKDPCGIVRTYQTFINPGFIDREVRVEVFRVKPYTSAQYPEERTRASG